MKTTNYVNEQNIAIETTYDRTSSNVFDENTRPDPKAIATAKDTLSPIAFTIYNTICSFKNRAFVTTSIEAFANQLNTTAEVFNTALQELITNKYLNYTQIVHNGANYCGNTFKFIPDNSLVAVVPSGFIAKTEEEYARLVEAWKKPFFFTGKIDTTKEVF